MPGLIELFEYEIEREKRDRFFCIVGITLLAIFLNIKFKEYGKNISDEVLPKKQRRNKQDKKI